MHKNAYRLVLAPGILIILLSGYLSGCAAGVLFQNVKPADQKSDSYGVMDLSAVNPDWTKLDPKSVDSNPISQDPATTATEISDVAFQSKKTASIISLNSACQTSKDHETKDLRTLTNILLLGASNVTLRDEKSLNISNTPALQTTLAGKINGEQIMLRTVVLQRQMCVYDLVYVARPQSFETHEQDFSHFVASLRLR